MAYGSSDLPLIKRDWSKVGVVVPTFNAAPLWEALRSRLDLQGLPPEQILIIDSSSTDGTISLAKAAGYRCISITKSDFNHGRTRQLGCDHFDWADILIYITQDALPADATSFSTLCSVFVDPKVGAACGRQLPRPGANAIERHARLFNYPETSTQRNLSSRAYLGIKAAFLSNSFAAYRRSALLQAGGFPSNVIMAEDSVVAARLLMGGWEVAYIAEAAVIHSHSLSIWQEFSRYFDTGVHHACEPWIRETFGGAGNEGKRFVISELFYLRTHQVGLIPSALIRTFSKLFAFQLGLREKYFPVVIKRSLSLQPSFWTTLKPECLPQLRDKEVRLH
ncbi:glycosyltransferase family 2 protein [Granulicella tundricola]|nr:glycosyltransferase family 2 protein [Granulicella tundricola]